MNPPKAVSCEHEHLEEGLYASNPPKKRCLDCGGFFTIAALAALKKAREWEILKASSSGRGESEMSKSLDGIKERNDHMFGHRKDQWLPILAGDYMGLRNEVDRLEKENGYHMRRMKMYEKQAVHLAAENDRLKGEIHHLETIELNAMETQYRKAHGLGGGTQ